MTRSTILLFLVVFSVLSAKVTNAETRDEDKASLEYFDHILENELKLAELQQDDSQPTNDDEVVEAQFWSFLAKHAGRAACKYLRRRPRVLEQNLHTWLQQDLASMEANHEVKMQGWFKRIRRWGRKVFRKVRRGIGRRVKRWYKGIRRKIGGGIRRYYRRIRNWGRKIRRRSRGWFKRLGRGIKRFARKAVRIGRTVCNFVYGKCKEIQE